MASGFGAGWRQVGICLLMMAAGAMVTSGYSVVAVPLAQEFTPSRMVLMLAMTIMMLVSGLLSPLLGMLMDRSSLRLLYAVGAGLIVAGLTAISFATSFVQVLVIYAVCMAAGNVLVGPTSAMVLLSRWFVKRRGAAIGIAVTGVSLGGFAYPPVAQLLLDSFHWREALRWFAAIVALCTLPALLFFAHRPSDLGLNPDGADTPPDPQLAGTQDVAFSLRSLLTDPTFWLLGTVFGVVMAGMMGMATSLVPLVVDEGIEASAGALLISVYAGGGFIAKLVFAAVADRLAPRHLLLIGIAGFAVGMACMIAAEAGYAAIVPGVALIGLFGGLMVPLQGILIPRIFGPHVVGRVNGILGVYVLGFLLVTPPAFGYVYDVTGNYDAMFMGFIALSALSMLVVPMIRVHPKAALSAPRPEPA